MKSIRVVLLILGIILSLFSARAAFSQDRKSQEVYSMMLVNFARQVQWPDVNRKDFTIGVVGNSELFNTLNSLYGGKTKGNKIISIKKFSGATDITTCDILFVDQSQSKEMDCICTKVKGQSTLVVTETEKACDNGSCINVRKVNDKIKFEVNQQALEAANLKVTGSLASVGIVI